jgi:hypothetical protein
MKIGKTQIGRSVDKWIGLDKSWIKLVDKGGDRFKIFG